MALVATLVANPSNPILTTDLAGHAADAAGARRIAWLAPGEACDLVLPSDDAGAARAALAAALNGQPVDVAVQPERRRTKRLLVADMDSTMIEQECIDELADLLGLKEEVAAITRQAMNGEIAFEPALRARVALLKDLPVATIDTVLSERITLAVGGATLIATMKRHGAHTLLVSGGFTRFTRPVAAMLGFDDHRANVLIEVEGRLTGRVAEPILGRQAKIEALEETVQHLGIDIADTLAVGDGANDLGMITRAGTGVALHAKPAVADAAPIRIDHGDLTALLYLQGYRRQDFVEPTVRLQCRA